MARHRVRAVGSTIVIAAAMAIAVSCSDASTAARPPLSSSDFVAEGMVYNQIWLPSASGLRLSSTSSVTAAVTSVGDKVRTRTDMGTFAVADSGAAQRLGLARASTPPNMAHAKGSEVPILLRGRHLGTGTVDGKRIARYAVPNDDRASGRPPRAMLIVVDDRIAAITEYTWAKKDGAWRAIRSRTSFFDESGALTMAYDHDATALQYRAAPSAAGLTGVLRDKAGLAAASVARLVQPDVLYAAPAEEESCLREGLAAMAAAAAVVGAGYFVISSQIALSAATEALTVGLAACMVNELTCTGLAALIAAEAAAAATYKYAQGTLAAALIVAAAADAALAECRAAQEERWKDPETTTGPSGGGESDCGDGEEEWCEYTLSVRDGKLHVQRNSCWCEPDYLL